MYRQMTLPGMGSATSSPESADGPALCDSPESRMISQSGPEAAHASHTPQQERDSGTPTRETCGRTSSASSRSAALCESLASKFQQRLGTDGSMEYQQTWKRKDTPAGRSYWEHTASARRTSDSDCTGWPTPTATDAVKRGAVSPRPGMMGLSETVGLAGWVTPSARHWKDTPGMSSTGVNPDGSTRTRLDQLPRQAALVSGPPSTSSPAGTENRGALDPEHSRWLMGYPAAWGSCGDTAMQSSRKSPRNSSKRVSSN